MGIILQKRVQIKRLEGAPKSLHEYVISLFKSYFEQTKKD